VGGVGGEEWRDLQATKRVSTANGKRTIGDLKNYHSLDKRECKGDENGGEEKNGYKRSNNPETKPPSFKTESSRGGSTMFHQNAPRGKRDKVSEKRAG